MPRRIEIDIAGTMRETVHFHGFRVKEALCKTLGEQYPGLLFDAPKQPQFMVGRQAWEDNPYSLRRHLEHGLDKVVVVCTSGTFELRFSHHSFEGVLNLRI